MHSHTLPLFTPLLHHKIDYHKTHYVLLINIDYCGSSPLEYKFPEGKGFFLFIIQLYRHISEEVHSKYLLSN